MVTDWAKIPGCPKCGEPMRLGHGETVDARIRRHFESVHEVSIGTVSADGRESFRMAYLRPVSGTTEAWWWVLLLEGPALVTKIRVNEWAVAWERNDRQVSQVDERMAT